MEENIISDEKLLKYFTHENLEEMSLLFSNGSFTDLINKYFYTSSRSDSVNSSSLYSDRNSNGTSTLEVMSSSAPNNTNNNNLNNNNNINNNNNAMYGNINTVASYPLASPFSSISQKNVEFNYSLFEKLNEDELSQQILLTIVLFCLLKKKNIPDEAKILINKYNYPHYDMIFPLILLKVKFLIKTKETQKAIDILTEVIYSYENYKLNLDEKKKDLKNIYTIETYYQNFKYFNNLFNYLFCMNRLDVKIKKLYFELKQCLYNLNYYSQAYNTILELYQKYPDDILIQFELAKDSVICSKRDKFNEALEQMKKNRDSQNDENTKKIYDNFIMYAEALRELALSKYDECKNYFENILKNDENNVLIKNNLAMLSIYKNNPKDCYEKLLSLYQDKKNDTGHEYIRGTLKSIQDKFYVKSK